MTNPEFIVEMARALAWPASVIAGIAIFRPAICRLVDRIGYVKWRELEIGLREDIDAAQPTEKLSELPEEIDAVAAKSPERALFRAWRSLEDDLRKLAATQTQRVPKTFRGLGMSLEQKDLVSNKLMKRISALRRAYRAAKRGGYIGEDDAIDFANAAYAAKGEIAKLLSSPTDQGGNK